MKFLESIGEILRKIRGSFGKKKIGEVLGENFVKCAMFGGAYGDARMPNWPH